MKMKTIGRRVCLVAGLSVAVVVGALGADLSAAEAVGASLESSLGHPGVQRHRDDTRVWPSPVSGGNIGCRHTARGCRGD
ncbi:hypothetical protein DP117_20760 [Brasilonema sp. UFV-L1]|nr:hypothetical protein [Brasilonema sp. UFV-L1]